MKKVILLGLICITLCCQCSNYNVIRVENEAQFVASEEYNEKKLSLLRAELYLEYDCGVPADGVRLLEEMLNRGSLVVVKHSRKGDTETDIRPLLKQFSVKQFDQNTLVLDLLVCAQSPSLNPQLIADAITHYCPEMTPDFAHTYRIEVYDAQNEIFR